MVTADKMVGTIKCRGVHRPLMGHKIITISEDGYRSLARLKSDKESFTEALKYRTVFISSDLL